MSEKLALIDTDVLIDFIHAVDKSADAMRRLRKFLENFQLIHLNDSVSETTVKLFDKYRLSHGVMIPDTIIAATAISYKIPLLTKNQKDFRFIDNLKLLTY